jgi:hypothetical protein
MHVDATRLLSRSIRVRVASVVLIATGNYSALPASRQPGTNSAEDDAVAVGSAGPQKVGRRRPREDINVHVSRLDLTRPLAPPRKRLA